MLEILIRKEKKKKKKEILIRPHFEPEGNSLKFSLGREHYLKLPKCNTEIHLYTLYARRQLILGCSFCVIYLHGKIFTNREQSLAAMQDIVLLMFSFFFFCLVICVEI